MKTIVMKTALTFMVCLILAVLFVGCIELDMGFEYEIDESSGTATITGIGRNKQNLLLTIPENINGYKVTAIADYAFKHCPFASVFLPTSIEYIGKGAFYDCTILISIYGLENTKITHIYDETFYNCLRLDNIELPDTITTIGKHAFNNCQAMTITKIPDTVRTIGEGAFGNCHSIERIEIPAGVASIQEYAFHACENLREVILNEGLCFINEGAFTNCTALESIVIPSTVYCIEKDAFYLCSALTNVTICEGVNRIETAAFAGTNISTIYLPPSIDYLGIAAIVSRSLTSINVHESNPYYYSIDGVVYGDPSLALYSGILFYPSGKTETSFSIPEGIGVIQSWAFQDTDLTELNIPQSIYGIGDNILSFSYSLKTIKYNGTIEEWLNIDKYPLWDANSPDYTIYCIDGQIAKDGTVTYK